MQNPWEEIKKGEYVLEKDNERIKLFNKKVSPEHQIQTQLIPDPFFGNKNAKVVLLMLNPGFGSNEAKNYKQNDFEKILLNNLIHKNSEKQFFSLDERFKGTDAYDYWTPRVKELNQNEFSNDYLSENIFCINLFPYHSKKYRKVPGELLESQYYSLHLLNNAINTSGTIVISMRSFRLWEEAYMKRYGSNKLFDELVKEGKLFKVKNYRNSTLSTANLGEVNFNKLKKELNAKLQ